MANLEKDGRVMLTPTEVQMIVSAINLKIKSVERATQGEDNKLIRDARIQEAAELTALATNLRQISLGLK